MRASDGATAPGPAVRLRLALADGREPARALAPFDVACTVPQLQELLASVQQALDAAARV